MKIIFAIFWLVGVVACASLLYLGSHDWAVVRASTSRDAVELAKWEFRVDSLKSAQKKK